MTIISSLVAKIEQWTNAYYSTGESLVSDETFNDSVNQLRQLDPGNPILTKVGFGYKHPSHRAETKHRQFISSIDDRVKFEDVKDSDYNWCSDPIIALTKIDGAGIAAYYRNGKLDSVVSRGDGEIGINITNNVIASGSIPLQIKTDKEFVDIRLEAAISWEDFQHMEASHPRNKASGLSQSEYSDPNELNKLICVAYHIFDWDNTKSEMMDQLKDWGFVVCPYRKFDNWNDFKNSVINETYNRPEDHQLANKLTLPCDGAVLVEDADPESCIAVKYFDESEITTCTDITWSATRTGKIVPVAHYEPIFLTGATLCNATCNNADWLKWMGVHPGAKLEIIRANMIIPTIIRVLDSDPDKISIPTHCPCCNSEVVTKENDAGIFCINEDCDAKKWEVISRLFYLGEVKGLGEAAENSFYSNCNITSIKSFKEAISDITLEKLLEFEGESTSEKLYENILAIKNFIPNVYNYIYLAAIPRVGDSSANSLCENITAEEFIQVLKTNSPVPESWKSYCSTEPGGNNLVEYFNRIRELAEFFDYKISEYVAPEVIHYKWKYALTGRFSVTKNELAEEFGKYDAEWVDVSDAQFILTNTPEKKSNKLKEAEARGVKIMSEDEFRKLIVEHNIHE